jgi:hypothetical protein
LALTSNIPTVSGTTNQVPVFNGTNSLTDSVITATSTIVSIGVTYGNSQLYIGGSPSQFTADLTDAGTRAGLVSILSSGGTVNGGGGIVLGTNTQSNATGFGQIAIKSLLIDGTGQGTADLAFSTRNAISDTALTERMRLTSNGNLYVGATTFTSPNGADKFIGVYGGQDCSLILQDAAQTWELYVNDDFYITRGATTALQISRTTGVTTISNLAGTGSRAVIADATGNLSAPVSDETVKENIQTLQYGLNAIMQLNPISFEYIDKYKNYGEGLQIGNIAQDVAKVIPEAVFTTPSTGLMGINYNQFDGIYIKAIQELNNKIDTLLQRIEILENK